MTYERHAPLMLARWLMFAAVACMAGMVSPGPGVSHVALVVAYAVANLALMLAPPKVWGHASVLPALVAVDATVFCGAMLLTESFGREAFLAYFAMLALVVIAGDQRLADLGAFGVAGAFATYLFSTHGASILTRFDLLGQMFFVFGAGAAYRRIMSKSMTRVRERELQEQLVAWVGKLRAAVSDEFDAHEILRQVLLDVQRAFLGNVRASLVQINEDALTVITTSDDRAFREQTLDPERYPELTAAAASAEPILIDDIRTNPLTSSVKEHVDKLPFTSLLLCPVKLEDPRMGHVVLRVARNDAAFSPSMVGTTQRVAEAIAVVFRQAKLHEAMQLAEKMEMVSQIANSVSHNFNAILSTVLLSAEVLRKEAQRHAREEACGANPFGQEGAARFRSIDNAVQEGLTIVERLTAWTRFGKKGQSGPAPTVLLDPRVLLEEAWRYAEPKWARREATRDLELRWQVRGTPAIEGDAAEIKEVLLNLIVNAIDAMPKGGVLTLGLDVEDERVVFRVEDTGVGISEELQERIFEPVFTTKGRAGTGLGLSVARSVAQRHRGELVVSSREGVGSCFKLTLPASERSAFPMYPEAVEADGSPDAGEGAHGRRVLLLEDNDLVSDVMERFLEVSGLEVDVVHSVDEAEVMLRTPRAYTGLLVGAQLPGAGAEALLKTLSRRREHLIERVIFYSTNSLPADLRELQVAYGFQFVDRSAGLAALREALGRIANLSDGSDEAAA